MLFDWSEDNYGGLLLNCTPNDLFQWWEDDKAVVPEGHALRTLKRDKDAPSATELLRDIPADKLEKLGEMLAELKNGSSEPNNE